MDDEKIRQTLEDMLSELRKNEEMSADTRAPVKLEQDSVGRLSRMDAMQMQAMALATQRRRDQEKGQILAALRRLEEGEYGACLSCGNDIAPRRLELNPAISLCIQCAS